jgi:uncharacterized protein (DUF1330 family)
MPAAYIVAEIGVKDPAAYRLYTDRTPGVIAAFGGRFVVRGGAVDAKEGTPPAGRVVVIEFPDMATAQRFYDSPEYREILPLRHAASRGRLYMVEGA